MGHMFLSIFYLKNRKLLKRIHSNIYSNKAKQKMYNVNLVMQLTKAPLFA